MFFCVILCCLLSYLYFLVFVYIAICVWLFLVYICACLFACYIDLCVLICTCFFVSRCVIVFLQTSSYVSVLYSIWVYVPLCIPIWVCMYLWHVFKLIYIYPFMFLNMFLLLVTIFYVWLNKGIYVCVWVYLFCVCASFWVPLVLFVFMLLISIIFS